MSLPKLELARLPRSVQWAVLSAVSVALSWLLGRAGLPAGPLLGPMLAGILVETNGGNLRISPGLYLAAQATVGGFLAGAVRPSILSVIARDWPLFILLVLAMVVATSFIGWAMSRLRLLPATTAIWGCSPGAAPAMILMAEAFGADLQLVAFMQFFRVALIAVVASAVAALAGHMHPAASAYSDWFRPIHWMPFLQTAALLVAGGLVGTLSRVPAGTLLGPLVAGIALHSAGLIEIEVPPSVVALTYAVVGWRIGLGFTRRILLHALRALPAILGASLATIAFSAVLALLLAKTAKMDLLTAYLATSPGGMDSVAIIAVSSAADISFVMALQTARFLLVLVVGPPLARFVARRSPRFD